MTTQYSSKSSALRAIKNYKKNNTDDTNFYWVNQIDFGCYEILMTERLTNEGLLKKIENNLRKNLTLDRNSV